MNSSSNYGGWLLGPILLSATTLLPAVGVIQQVGCNCQNGGGAVAYEAAPHYMPAQAMLPIAESYGPAWSAPPTMGQTGAPLVVGATPPPPGTLGRTYQLPAKLLPADEHPRVAMLDIRAPGADEVVVEDTYEFREEESVVGFQSEEDENLWHFKTKPLMPGQPNVVRIELRSGGKVTDVRYVRLIANRLIELSF
jgi:hypothetical protein